MNEKICQAYLTVPVIYSKEGLEIIVPKNTLVLVDIERETALIGDDSVYVESSEYQVLSV